MYSKNNASESKAMGCYRVSIITLSANALLDRSYGKPAVKEETDTVDLQSVVIQLTQ